MITNKEMAQDYKVGGVSLFPADNNKLDPKQTLGW